jgi:general stress protein YciG
MTKSSKQQGFAVMDPVRQREIASRGGIAAHSKGTAHTWDSQAAREAGRKGAAVNALKRKKGA